jgi:hypothetical protein
MQASGFGMRALRSWQRSRVVLAAMPVLLLVARFQAGDPIIDTAMVSGRVSCQYTHVMLNAFECSGPVV